MLAEFATRHAPPVHLREPGRRQRRADLRRRLVRAGSRADACSRRCRTSSRASRWSTSPAPGPGSPPDAVVDPDAVAQLERGLVLGIRDYFRKQDLPPGAVVGLSGGIDSAVTAWLAVEALGAERVVGLAMPGPFSSEPQPRATRSRSVAASAIEVRRLDIRRSTRPTSPPSASSSARARDYGLTQQNIQARIRGALLMAISNAEGRLVLATGNKSELSMGYCTLYGDTVGGLAVLGDVYKRDVYALARRANAHGGADPARQPREAAVGRARAGSAR